MTRGVLAVLMVAAVAGSGGGQPPGRAARPADWRAVLADRAAGFGHRNWIVVADAAYPAQARSGVETVVTGADHPAVLRAVLDELGRAKHVRPVVHLDAELPHVPDRDAPGITAFRRELKATLDDRKPLSAPHDQLLDRLDKAGDKYRVLVLKTELTLPYSSVFIEIDAAYWSPEAEKRLRDAMDTGKK